MSIQRTKWRIAVFVLLPALAFYLGLRLFAQYRRVPVYVSRVAPIPPELAARLHIEEHKIDRTVTVETPYEEAADKRLARRDIRRLRSQIAWSGVLPPFIDSLTIESTTNVVARRTTSRVMVQYRLAKHGERWIIQDVSRSHVDRVSP